MFTNRGINLPIYDFTTSSFCSISLSAIGIVIFYSSSESFSFNLHFLIISEVVYGQIWLVVTHIFSFISYLLISFVSFHFGLFHFVIYLFCMLILFQLCITNISVIFSLYLWHLLMKNNSNFFFLLPRQLFPFIYIGTGHRSASTLYEQNPN